MRPHYTCAFAAFACVCFVAAQTIPQPQIPTAIPATTPGQPIPGLTAQQLQQFLAGKEDFEEMEEVADGLGPAFNGSGCSTCHNLPAVGGVGNVKELRAGTLNNNQFLAPPGGSLVHLFSIPDHRCQPAVPANANVMAHRLPTPLFGAGLVEAIPDAAIAALETSPRRDGISGRAAWLIDPATGMRRVGRFGWKAQHATLLSFSADAYVNEMGITNAIFRSEVAAGLTPQQLAVCDTVPDPEDRPDPITGLRAIDLFTNFMRFLAPVARAPLDAGVSRQGEALFTSTGCAACHVPALATGTTAAPGLANRLVPAFSDFLLHDIGTGDGIAQAAAAPDEIRTAPLWGLRFRRLLLHDGSALSVPDAIRQHGGEARLVRERFDRLTPPERQALLAFLNSL